MSAVAVAVGDELPELVLTITRAGIVHYAGASTDFNPIHWSDRKARELGLPGVLAHGMWTMGACLRIVTDWCGSPSAVLDYSARFTHPVQVPDDDQGVRVFVTARVTELVGDIATVAVDARVDAVQPEESGTGNSAARVKVLGNAKAHVRITSDVGAVSSQNAGGAL